MKIILNTLKEKISLLRESEYVHYLVCNNTSKSSTLSHIYMNSKLIELDTNNDLELLLNKLYDEYYRERFAFNIKIKQLKKHSEYYLYLETRKFRGMNVNTRNVGNVESKPKQEELYFMIKEWLDNEIKEFNVGLDVN
jgi:hypothetical protein